jgi:hypothetical protein
MDSASLKTYYNKPCKFRLKSGKDVYGVVWADDKESSNRFYFSSSEDYNLIKSRGEKNSALKTLVNLNDIVAAEMLQGIVPGKDMFK